MINAISNTNSYQQISKQKTFPKAKISFGQGDDEFTPQNPKEKKEESFLQKHWVKILIATGVIVAGAFAWHKFKKAPKQEAPKSSEPLKQKPDAKSETKPEPTPAPKVETDDALKALNQQIENNPNNPAYYHSRATRHRDLGHYSEAISDYEKILKFDPKNPNPYIEIGLTYKKMENYNKALDFYSKAIEIAPQNPLAHYNRALLHWQIKLPEKAFDDIDQAIKLNPADEDYQVAKSKMEQTPEGNIHSQFKKFLEAHINDEYSTLGQRAEVYGRIGFINQSVEDAKKAISLNPPPEILERLKEWITIADKPQNR